MNYEQRAKEIDEEDVKVKIPEFVNYFSCNCYSSEKYNPNSKRKCSTCQRAFNFVDVKILGMAKDWVEKNTSDLSVFIPLLHTTNFDEYLDYGLGFSFGGLSENETNLKKEEYEQLRSSISIINRESKFADDTHDYFKNIDSFHFSVEEYYKNEAKSILYFTTFEREIYSIDHESLNFVQDQVNGSFEDIDSEICSDKSNFSAVSDSVSTFNFDDKKIAKDDTQTFSFSFDKVEEDQPTKKSFGFGEPTDQGFYFNSKTEETNETFGFGSTESKGEPFSFDVNREAPVSNNQFSFEESNDQQKGFDFMDSKQEVYEGDGFGTRFSQKGKSNFSADSDIVSPFNFDDKKIAKDDTQTFSFSFDKVEEDQPTKKSFGFGEPTDQGFYFNSKTEETNETFGFGFLDSKQEVYEGDGFGTRFSQKGGLMFWGESSNIEKIEVPTRKQVTHQYCVGKIDKLPQIIVNNSFVTYPGQKLLFDHIFQQKTSFDADEVKILSHDFDITSKDSKIIENISHYMNPDSNQKSTFEYKFTKLILLGNESIKMGNNDVFGYLYVFLPSVDGVKGLNLSNSYLNVDFDFSLHEQDLLNCHWMAFEKNSILKFPKSSGNQIALVYEIQINPEIEKDTKLQYPNERIFESPILSLLNLLELNQKKYHIFLNDDNYDGRNLNPDDFWILSNLRKCEDWNIEFDKLTDENQMKLNDKSIEYNHVMNLEDEKERSNHLITLKLKTKLTFGNYLTNLNFSFQ
eukprot:gene9745-2072_t